MLKYTKNQDILNTKFFYNKLGLIVNLGMLELTYPSQTSIKICLKTNFLVKNIEKLYFT